MVSILINSLAGGGAEKVVLTLLKEFKQAGVPVELVLLEKERFYDLPEGVKVHYLTDFEQIKNPFRKFFYVFISALRLKRYIKKKEVKVVQSHLIRSNYINVLAKVFGAGHKTQIVNHMMVSFDKKRGFLGKANLWLYKQLYAKSDMIVSISRVMKQDLDEFFKLKKRERHMVIYNPHDVDFIKARADEKPEVFEFDPNKKYLVSVGRLVERKRVDLTIKALAKVRETYPQTELLVLGSGEELDHYKKITSSLQLDPYVHFLGFISNPFSYLSRADIFVLASTDEGLPNIIIESMICGTAVVSSDCKSGPRETLNPESDIQTVLKDEIEIGDYGVLFPVKDVDRLANALIYMLEDQERREDFVMRGEGRAEDFRSEKVAQTYIGTFGLDTPAKIGSV